MDLAYSYDHVTNAEDRARTPTPPSNNEPTPDPTTPRPTSSQPARQNLQTEFQETFKAFSNSPWGAKLGGLWGNVRKQGESYYEEAVREAEAARVDAVKGFQGIVGRVRSLSVNEKEALEEASAEYAPPKSDPVPGEESVPAATTQEERDKQLEDNETFLNRFKTEAAKRLKEVQKAEDAADEALLRFGTNIRNFLRDAVAVSAPEDSQQPGEVLFESKDSTGKRTIHTSRMDAQLHLIHTSPSRLTSDPTDSGAQWDSFKNDFDVEKQTDKIGKDLEAYPDLRATMEALVPEKVEYKDFWTRYYFLRQALEAQEEKRRELLKGTFHSLLIQSKFQESFQNEVKLY
jgi:BSD domain